MERNAKIFSIEDIWKEFFRRAPRSFLSSNPNLIFTGDIFEKSNIFKFIYYFSSWKIFLKN